MTRIALFAAASLAVLTLAACGNSTNAQDAAEVQAAAVSASLVTGNETPAEMEKLYADFLAKYVSDTDGINFVAYGDVSADDAAILKAYIASLETRGVEGLSRDEQMAFWYNLYNAKTIDVILDNYPTSSIRKLGVFNSGPWDDKNMNVAGVGPMSLNDVEHGTLRKNWDEPRIHYAVNCASFGCPNLKASPWTAATLETDMDAAARGYINHPRGFRAQDGKVIASKIFNWYKEDFGGNDAGVLEHARQYAEGDLKTALDAATKINSFEYNWDLNEG